MTKLKSLALGAVAAGAISGAHAADLPLAEPVEYVQICDAYGKGFFYIPGTDTCLRLSGLVRVDYRWEETDGVPGGVGLGGAGQNNDFATDIRGRVMFDARSETEWGTLRSVIEYEARADGTSGYSNGRAETFVRNAYIQFAGVTAGLLVRSLYDYVPYKIIASGIWSDEPVNTLAYTAKVADGIELTVGLEDKYFRAVPQDTAVEQEFPNGIATLVIKQAWGDFKLAGAIQDQEGDGDAVVVQPDEIGWAFLGGVTVNLPSEVKGSKVYAIGTYTEGALSYIGGEDFTSNFANDGFATRNPALDQRNGVNTVGWAAGGGILWQWTKEWATSLTALYADVDQDGTFTDYEYLFVEGNVYWSPVPNLELGLAVNYGDLELTDGSAPVTSAEDDHWAGILRLARAF